MEDGFEWYEFNLHDFGSLDVDNFGNNDTSEITSDLVHKSGLKHFTAKLVSITRMVGVANYNKIELLNEFLILLIYGKRNMKKEAVELEKLSSLEREVYYRISNELSNQSRRTRIYNFIRQRCITKRLINYFVVQYILTQREISYYLDKRTYPYKVIGEYNKPNQPDILRLISQGHNIVWINLHQEYKTSKNKKGRRNLHAPYARSVTVKEIGSLSRSLGELNFYIWLDDVGAYDVFYAFESDIRDQKAKYDEEKRNQDAKSLLGGKRTKQKKRKVVLKHTDGKNYRTFIVNYERPAPFHPEVISSISLSNSLDILRQFNDCATTPDVVESGLIAVDGHFF
jgi:hypothetical protein